MNLHDEKIETLGIIAGKGVYPLLLAESARKQGVKNIIVFAFKGETDSSIKRYADRVEWIYMGQLVKLLEAMKDSGVRKCVMVGQITPSNLFNVRPDAAMFSLLAGLKRKNAETIYGAVAAECLIIGAEIMPASMFMEAHMPTKGTLTTNTPTETQSDDIKIGIEAAKTTSSLGIGQTVVIKEGMILAVEAFEGTDKTILRAGELGGPGSVVVKVAQKGHDMRFDIPVIGLHTMKVLKKAKVSVLAVEAGRCIFLEREEIIREADKLGIAVTVFESL